MKYFVIFLILICFAITSFGSTFGQQEDLVPSEKTLVPYTENYNVRFTSDGKIDYDLLIAKIMPEIFEEKLLAMGVDVARKDIVLSRGPQLSIYQPSSYNCGYVVDYTDRQVYWLEAAINSTHIQYAKIFTETPAPNGPPGIIEEWNLGWCFGPLKEKVSAIFLEDKSYLTQEEESIIAAAIKHELRGNPSLGNQEFKVGKFNFDYGEDVLAFCGEFQNPFGHGLNFFGGAMQNSILDDFHLESSMSPLCAINKDAKIFSVSFSSGEPEPGLERWKNNRMETVYLKPHSVEKLLERNYMMVKPAHNMIMEYSTSLNVDFISYHPNDSNTIFELEPSQNDTFVKIRIPQNGGNYYMSYGPNEWNKGDLTSVAILVDGIEVPYKEQLYVQAPDAPYPQYFTDYIFKFPAKSSMFNVILFIENYVPDSDHSDDEWDGYAPVDDY
ncbi:hypothetical protein [Candidatus Nitrosopumilus sediminis]|uniref:Uncharacterized protein n=1 Tax=Candidatus Nitrosopumilus sediminis TaxID=1229909 RepID=K0B9W9_9ARCH|nr:hypothetical protein [Candidatus Nitrosopumilus sediminis]AFS82993.1 hypothetical protein NSED_05955 [Candidatus Nitrosopumilus sediminis]